MTTLLQVSDPHFGTERPEVVQGLLRLAQALRPDVVLLSGDLTQRATAAQFAAARRFADALCAHGAALLAVPGNHDIPLFDLASRALCPYARYRRAFGPALEGGWDGPALQLSTLNTTRRWRHEDGQISARQIDAVAARLAVAQPRQLRVVAAHHPMGVPRRSERNNLLHGHEAALRRWAAAGADVVLGGHIHLPCVLPMHESLPGGLARKLWVVQAGTAVSSRVRHDADNSVNVLRVHDRAAGCSVERWDWVPPRGAFERVQEHQLL